ncbi:hypothetical protein DHEL01_v206270 [Diaporthe helianthi]|uniref:Uncharacterized protein n=1 Tax=Diaporthe helianthi TaxID=158607 RepID=A0A2P5HYL5_DIAHE|nr:hypothetical protein DHEL01_v206270 [Diaporthe helianthi]
MAAPKLLGRALGTKQRAGRLADRAGLARLSCGKRRTEGDARPQKEGGTPGSGNDRQGVYSTLAGRPNLSGRAINLQSGSLDAWERSQGLEVWLMAEGSGMQ